MAHALTLDGTLHEVWLSRSREGYQLHLDERSVVVAMRVVSEHQHELVVGDTRIPVHVAVHGDEIFVHMDGTATRLTYAHNMERFAAQTDDLTEATARAPMPGAVISVQIAVGQAVQRGDVMVIIESMKMETAICAGLDGVVQQVHVQAGQTFDRDAVLVTLAPSAERA